MKIDLTSITDKRAFLYVLMEADFFISENSGKPWETNYNARLIVFGYNALLSTFVEGWEEVGYTLPHQQLKIAKEIIEPAFINAADPLDYIQQKTMKYNTKTKAVFLWLAVMEDYLFRQIPIMETEGDLHDQCMALLATLTSICDKRVRIPMERIGQAGLWLHENKLPPQTVFNGFVGALKELENKLLENDALLEKARSVEEAEKAAKAARRKAAEEARVCIVERLPVVGSARPSTEAIDKALANEAARKAALKALQRGKGQAYGKVSHNGPYRFPLPVGL